MPGPWLTSIDGRWWKPLRGDAELELAVYDETGVYSVRLTRRQAHELLDTLGRACADWPDPS